MDEISIGIIPFLKCVEGKAAHHSVMNDFQESGENGILTLTGKDESAHYKSSFTSAVSVSSLHYGTLSLLRGLILLGKNRGPKNGKKGHKDSKEASNESSDVTAVIEDSSLAREDGDDMRGDGGEGLSAETAIAVVVKEEPMEAQADPLLNGKMRKRKRKSKFTKEFLREAMNDSDVEDEEELEIRRKKALRTRQDDEDFK